MPDYTRVIEEWNQEGRFITFPSYEIHSCSEGDYVVYSAQPIDTVPQVKSMKELRELLKKRNRRDKKPS